LVDRVRSDLGVEPEEETLRLYLDFMMK